MMLVLRQRRPGSRNARTEQAGNEDGRSQGFSPVDRRGGEGDGSGRGLQGEEPARQRRPLFRAESCQGDSVSPGTCLALITFEYVVLDSNIAWGTGCIKGSAGVSYG